MGLASVPSKHRAACQSDSAPGDSPVDSFLTSVYAVKDALLPVGFESSIRRAAKDLEASLLTPKRRAQRKEQNSGMCTIDKQISDLSVQQSPADSLPCAEEPKKASLTKFPLKIVWGNIFQNAGKSRKVELMQKKLARTNVKVSGTHNSSSGDEEKPCTDCLFVALARAFLLGSFLQAIPSHFKAVKKCFGKYNCHRSSPDGDQTEAIETGIKFAERACRSSSFQFLSNDFPFKKTMLHRDGSWPTMRGKNLDSTKEGENISFELFLNFVAEHCFQSGKKNEQRNCSSRNCNSSSELSVAIGDGQKLFVLPEFPDVGFLQNLLKGRNKEESFPLANLRFARVGGASDLLGPSAAKEDNAGRDIATNETETNSAQKLAAGLFNVSLPNVERLKSTLSAVSLAELMELVPQIRRSSQDYPDKKKLFSVQDFFRYTQSEGRRFFEELDRDGDGQVTLEDLEVAMRKRRLPRRYAREFLQRTKNHFFAKSFGWKQFLSLMEQKEPTMLRAYNSLCLSKSGTLQKSQVLASLKSAGLPATEENVIAMMRFLDADTEGSISYGHFRNFMLLLPPERLEDDPRSLWFEAATVVAVAPPVAIPASSVLKSALAGGLACALSTSLMHPVDTMKTRVQASTLSFPELVSKLPQIGLRGLYRGSIPAILGQFSSHGLRTGIFEASKMLLTNVAPTIPEIQVQSLSSFCSTIIGTAVRIPCEVLKQRLQAGIFDSMGDAIIGTWQQDGLKGFFRGTGATLCREVPFYVAGTGLYEQAKKVAQQLLNRNLEPWETIVVGALSGGLAAVSTTPFDVLKTRMMTAPPGMPTTMTAIAFTILQQEGPFGLFKGAVPRFFWIAPLGAMNFAGYELAKKAMDNAGDNVDELSPEKRLVKAG